MPRIRKKTSKRGSTNQREKIKHKAVETRKKRKKAEKKNTQWKSKHEKDLGIPNNFPYKDQILAEVAEQRRQAEEAKQHRKELRKAAKAGAEAGADEASDHEESENGFDGIAAIHHATLASGSKPVKTVDAAEVKDDEVPVLINPEWSTLKAVLATADVVVEMLDARDPLAYRSSHIEEVVKEKDGQKLLFVLNKIDACPREAVSSWTTSLRAEHPTLMFRSASAFLPSDPTPVKGKGKARADDALGIDSVLSILEKWAQKKADGESLVVAVVGVTNTGKSSFVNSLIRKAAVPIYQLGSVQEGPSTTTHAQEVTLEISGKKIRLVDTPGISWVPPSELTEMDAASLRARDILTRNKGRIDRLKDPEPVVRELVARGHREDLMLFYNLPAYADGDTTAFLSALARAHDMIKKAGVLDILGAARMALRDWSTGKFPRYTVPAAAGSVTPADSSLFEVYAKDEQVLAALTPRKELRKSSGLVKLSAGAVDDRKVALEASWIGSEESSDEDEGDEDEDEDAAVWEDEESGDDEEVDEIDSEDEEEEDELEEDEEETPVQPTGKRKRRPTTVSDSPPAKKVAFAPEPKNTKQARSAAGARGASVTASRKAETKKTSSKAAAKPSKSKPPAKVVVVKKAANATASKKSTANNKPGEEAYDFKSFF